MAATMYHPADEVQEIAESLIVEHHLRLTGVRIDYVFINKIPKKGNKQVWGTCRKITNLSAYLADSELAAAILQPDDAKSKGVEPTPFFVVIISKPIWDVLPYDKKVALVDHELCHAGVEEAEDGSKKLYIIPHDLEEFIDIVKRHGLWEEGIEGFVKAAKEKLEATGIK